MASYDQADYDIRFDWGLPGMRALAPISHTVVIVDVLSFTTSVTIAVHRGGRVVAYGGDGWPGAFAEGTDACLSVDSDAAAPGAPYSPSPRSWLRVEAGESVVLPSHNSAAVAFAAERSDATVLAGALLNATAVGAAANTIGRTTSVIASGDRWEHGGELRPTVEDLVGAGAIITHLAGRRSPEAEAAAAAFERARVRLSQFIADGVGGRALAKAGHADDVALACKLDATQAVGVLRQRAFEKWHFSAEE